MTPFARMIARPEPRAEVLDQLDCDRTALFEASRPGTTKQAAYATQSRTWTDAQRTDPRPTPEPTP